MHSTTTFQGSAGHVSVRTCVGCGRRDDAPALVRVVVDTERTVTFDLAGGAFGRGAHVHARETCLAKAPRGIARALGRGRVEASELGSQLVAACDRRMFELVSTARRLGAVAVGTDAVREAMRRRAPLIIVAVDAVAPVAEWEAAIVAGRAIAWHGKSVLGALLGVEEAAVCAVLHDALGIELKKMRTARDAGAALTRDGAACSRLPEAR